MTDEQLREWMRGWEARVIVDPTPAKRIGRCTERGCTAEVDLDRGAFCQKHRADRMKL